MREKYGKFYADWYDEDGRRHTKALDTKLEAKQFKKEREAEILLRKKARASASKPTATAQLRSTAKRGRMVGARTRTSSSRANSRTRPATRRSRR
jgi:hypothetical protein